MWIWLDKNGVVKQYLMHGPSPVVGDTNFSIFVYCDGIDTDFYSSATIKFRKPDLDEGTYPVLFMKRVTKTYEPMQGETSTLFTANHDYTGFEFSFSDFTSNEEIVRLLDTPGMWSASVSLLGSPNKVDVTGLITFSVGPSTFSDEDQTELTLDQILEGLVLSQNYLKQDSTLFIKSCPDFIDDADHGELLTSLYTIGSIVFDETTHNFYRILTITNSPADNTYSFATYEKAFRYLKIIDASSTITLGEISALDESSASTVLLRIDEEYYLAYVSKTDAYASFTIESLATGLMYRGTAVSSSLQLSQAITDAYKLYYTVGEIDAQNEGAYHYLGDKTVEQLNGLTGQRVGDTYRLINSGTLIPGNLIVLAGEKVFWTGTAWDKLAPTIDLSMFLQKSSTLNSIYAVSGSGEQINLPYSADNTNGTVPIRHDGGQIDVAELPILSTNAASKGYVDREIATVKRNAFIKVDFVEYPTLDSFLASTGEEGYIYLYPIDTTDLTKGYYQYTWEGTGWVSLGSTQIDFSNYYTKQEIDALLATKQAVLVSGSNIKTINGQSVLGSGDLETVAATFVDWSE